MVGSLRAFSGLQLIARPKSYSNRSSSSGLTLSEDRSGGIAFGRYAEFITVGGNPLDTPVFDIHRLFAKMLVYKKGLVFENHVKSELN